MTGSSEYLFISDLHLDQNNPEITEHFLQFVRTRAARARVLFILGDLFEVWLGDDDEVVDFHPVFDSLAQLSRSVDTSFIHGNRDFLVGMQFADRTGIKLIQEPTVITLGSTRVGLMHGDLLCTDDVDYQDFRRMVRSPDWQQMFLGQPLRDRRRLAAELREKSSEAMASKQSEIMDVNQQAVEECFDELNIDVLIHGHTHRPAIHTLDRNRTRIVLGDWNPKPSFLSWTGDRFELHDPRL